MEKFETHPVEEPEKEEKAELGMKKDGVILTKDEVEDIKKTREEDPNFFREQD
jgi:hypothetical protein